MASSAASLPPLQPERSWLCLPKGKNSWLGRAERLLEPQRSSDSTRRRHKVLQGASPLPGPPAEGDGPGRHLAHWASLSTVNASSGPFHCISKQIQERPGPRSQQVCVAGGGQQKAAIPGDRQSSLLLSMGFSESASSF